MENARVMITNMTDGRVVINVPDLHLKRIWEKKGAKKPIDLETLREAIYDPGVEYMFQTGMLYIDDMAIKKELYLEPDDATEPQNIKIMDEKLMKRLATVAPLTDMKTILKEYSIEQVRNFTEYMIENEIANMDKCDYIKKEYGIDILKAIQLNRLNKEA